jgi:hypothetical protein
LHLSAASVWELTIKRSSWKRTCRSTISSRKVERNPTVGGDDDRRRRRPIRSLRCQAGVVSSWIRAARSSSKRICQGPRGGRHELR